MSDQIILRERVITIKTGEPFDQALYGNVLRVTAGAVPLRVQSRDGQLDFTILAGEKARFPDDNPALILSHTSGADQTFTIQVGSGVDVASALLSGSVVISGTPTVINGGGVLTDITNTVKVREDGSRYGASYRSITPVTGNTPETVFTGAANPNGAVVWVANIWSHHSSAITKPAFVMKSSAPATIIDGSILLSTQVVSTGCGATLMRPIFVPAGGGLYYITALTEENTARNCLYTLL